MSCRERREQDVLPRAVLGVLRAAPAPSLAALGTEGRGQRLQSFLKPKWVPPRGAISARLLPGEGVISWQQTGDCPLAMSSVRRL